MSQTTNVALVTGANKGIGNATAARLGALGMTVLVGARESARGEEAAAALRARGAKARFVLLDVTDASSIAAATTTIERDYGRLDVLVNNAGVAHGGGPPSAQPIATMRELFETNFFGAVATTQALLPLLRRADGGRIVNVSSSLGSLALAADPTTPIAQQNAFFGYAATKTALAAFTIRLAAELGSTSIKVNAACPGYVATDLNQHRGTRTAEEGAAIVVNLATLPPDGPSGGFFNDAGRVPF
jgi:NAD(P)-dependent dehydrogenase (short-subunit alcohol dehydrogenase family)